MLGYHVIHHSTNHSIPVVVTEESYHQGTTKHSIPHRLARNVGLDPKKKPLEFDQVGTKLAKDFDDLYVGLGLGDE
jgi:hypothetical protein